MLVKFTFDVRGDIRIDDGWPIHAGGEIIECKTKEDGTIIAISVTVKDDDETHWPKIIDATPPAIAHVYTGHQPHLPFIVADLMVLQGMLSVYRHIEINLNEPIIEWIPQNEEERKKLGAVDKIVDA